METWYKAIRQDGTSWYDGVTRWSPGLVTEVHNPDKRGTCGHGIHLAKTLCAAISYQQGPSDYIICEPYGKKWAEDEFQARFTGARYIRMLGKEEQDELAGFKLWEANHPVNPLLIERDESLDLQALLREWVSIWASVEVSISFSFSVADSIRASAWFCILDSVKVSVRESVRFGLEESVVNALRTSVVTDVLSSLASARVSVKDAVMAYIGGLFPNITKWEYIKGSDPWRPLLTLWYGGYVPSFDGSKWRLHAGKQADVVFGPVEIKPEKRR